MTRLSEGGGRFSEIGAYTETWAPQNHDHRRGIAFSGLLDPTWGRISAKQTIGQLGYHCLPNWDTWGKIRRIFLFDSTGFNRVLMGSTG